jgi:hypothetical protein
LWLQKNARWPLTLIKEQRDVTLDEVVSAMRKHGIAGSCTAVRRFFKRHTISSKKTSRTASACGRRNG